MANDEKNDTDLFAEAMKGVTPLKAVQRIRPPIKKLSTRARHFEMDEQAALQESLLFMPDDPLVASGEVISYRSAGIQDSVMRKLRRGTFKIQAELDLHGMNSDQARVAVHQFIQTSRDLNHRCVRIIHGKGLRSSNDGPVLKSRVDSWLRRRNDVLAFQTAQPHDGGAGAVYVLLRRSD